MASHGLVPVQKLRCMHPHVDIGTAVTPVFGAEMEGAVPGPSGRSRYHRVLAPN